MIEVWVILSPLIGDVTPKYVVGRLGLSWFDFIFDSSFIVMFMSFVFDLKNMESFESKSYVIRYHAHLLISRAPPTK